MDVTFPPKRLADFRRSTRRYIPEDRTVHNHRCENLKYHINLMFLLSFQIILI
jgi:hypothetical protein